MNAYFQASVGRNVSLYLSADVVQPQVDSLVTTVIHDLCTQREDQCVLMYGSKVSGKSLVFNIVVSSLISQLLQDNIYSIRLLEGNKLLSLLTACEGDTECIMATSMYVAPTKMELCGGHFSCLLLNTVTLDKLQVTATFL